MATRIANGTEMGASGVKVYNGILYNSEDYNADFQNQRGMKIYDKMRSSDGEIAACLARLTLPLLSAEWRVDPAEDDPQGEEIADFVRDVLIERKYSTSPQDDSFTDFVRHALLMLPFGFMAFEKVWGVNEKGQQVITKLAPRLPKTFDQFQFLGPNGEFSGARQFVWNPRSGRMEFIVIPAEKLLLFVFGREGDNFWGRSILRAAYKHWDLKDKILWVDAASIERFGMGVLELHATEDASATEKEDAEDVAKNFTAHEKQFLYTPLKFIATFHHPPSGQSRAIDSANYHDQQESRSMMSEFMATGTAQTGSRSVVSTKVDLLMMAEKGTANLIEEGTERQVIRELVDRNFGVRKAYPQFKCEDIDKMTGTQIADILKPLADAKLIVPDKPLREHIRTVLDLPEIDEATQDPEPVMVAPFGGGGQPNEPAAPKPEPDASKIAKASQVVPISRLNRDLKPHEMHVEMERIAQYFDEEPVRIWHRVIKPIRDQQIAAISDRAAVASDAALAQGQLIRPREKEMTYALSSALMDCYMHGRRAVVDELARQRVAKQDEGDDSEEDIAPSDAQRKWIGRIAAGFSATSLMAMIAEAVRSGLNARQSDLPQDEVRASVRQALTDLSEPRVMADLAGKVSQSFTTGRNDQFDQMSDQFDTFYYSAVMDANTCGPCEALDGADHEYDDPSFETPNPDCDGGIDRCRCITIGVARDAAA